MQTYKLSGKKTVFGMLITVLVALLAALVLGSLYAVLVTYIPIIYILFFITGGYGIGLGISVEMGAQYARVRDPKFIYLMSLLTGAFGVYVSWVAWLYLYEGSLIFSPLEVLLSILRVGEYGVWTIQSYEPRGLVLYGVWLIEALGIMGLTLFMTSDLLKKAVYCETCHSWLKFEDMHAIQLEELNKNEGGEKLMQGDLSVLKRLKSYKNLNAENELPSSSVRVSLKKCSSCHELCVLDVEEETYSKNKEGEIETHKKDILSNLLITSSTYKELKNHW